MRVRSKEEQVLSTALIHALDLVGFGRKDRAVKFSFTAGAMAALRLVSDQEDTKRVVSALHEVLGGDSFGPINPI